MLRQVNEILQGAFPEWFPEPQQPISRKVIPYIPGFMTYERVSRMNVQASNTGQLKEAEILDSILHVYLLPMRWNMMDIEFGIASL